MQANIHIKGYIHAGLAVLIWSGFILVSRTGGISPLTPYDITALRFGTAALLLIPVCILKPALLAFNSRMLLLAGTGGIGYALLVYTGFEYAPASHGAILLPGLLPFEIAFLAWLFTGERLSRALAFGLVFILAGVFCLARDTGMSGTTILKGDVLFFLASICWSVYTVLIKRWSIPVWQATINTALIAALIYLPVYGLFLPKAMASATWTIISMQAIYQGIFAVIIAMFFYLSAVSIIGPTRTGAMMALIPAISGFAAIPILNETVSILLATGLVLVCIGAWLGSKSQIAVKGGPDAIRKYSYYARRRDP